MAIKRIFALLMVAIALIGCHKADVETQVRPSTHRDYADLFASIDNAESRVYMNSDLSLAWHGDDHITVFYGNDHNNQIEHQEHPYRAPHLTQQILRIAQRTHVKHLGSIQLLISFQVL